MDPTDRAIKGFYCIYVKYLTSNILERAFWSLQPFQGFLLLENAKNIRHKCFFANMIKHGTYAN